MAQYCKACGAALGEDGICTNETCKRRALQLAAKNAQAAADEAKSNEQSTRLAKRAKAKTSFLGARSKMVASLAINADWQ